MSKITHGGPAFPVPLHPGQSYQGHAPCDGMTLRDYFAAKALAAVWRDIPDDAERSLALRELGVRSYEMADAMLAARGAQ
ncbi:hypothetical protein ACOTDT_17005 [Achromobacter xylosoxidans]|uniref:hypothetical protein n=1 Tax=Alcaligenes xylosoxydans xylosoxydans TaxID=85698 RepID=UPI001F111B67|nr:hypothetical protein [Achromobacter xylosoxidans]MCH4572224.1 hypothetical protein [Achromobacter xylosoxidans]